MRKMLIALGLFAALMVAAPRTASAHVGISIGLPGFGLAIGLPTPPVFFAPPVVYGPTYYAPAYPTYYAPAYPTYYGGYGYYGRGYYGRGYYGRGYYGRGYYGRPVYYGRPAGHHGWSRGGWRY